MKCTEVFQSLTNLYIMHVKHGVIKPPKEQVCMCLNAVCFSMTLMNWRVSRDRRGKGQKSTFEPLEKKNALVYNDI